MVIDPDDDCRNRYANNVEFTVYPNDQTQFLDPSLCAAPETKAAIAQEQAEVRTKKIKSERGKWWNKSPYGR